MTKFKTKVLDLSLNLDLSPFVKSAPGFYDKVSCNQDCTHKLIVNESKHSYICMRSHGKIPTSVTKALVKSGSTLQLKPHVEKYQIELNNRFIPLSNIVSNESENQHCINTDIETTSEVNILLNKDDSVENKCDTVKCASHKNTSSKNMGNTNAVISSNTTRNFDKQGKLPGCVEVAVRDEDKYDLQLRFRPKHRLKIQEAKDNHTFKLWNEQMRDKYGIVPLGDLYLPECDKEKT